MTCSTPVMLCYQHGNRERLTVPLPRHEVLQRLREAVPEPAPARFDPFEDVAFGCYVRADAAAITVRLYGYDDEALTAEGRRIVHALTCQGKGVFV